jgi:hypothetical protein
MKKAPTKTEKPRRRASAKASRKGSDELRAEYDFSNGVRGKYAHLFGRNRTVRAVVLAPDVAEGFRSARAVNAALRRLLKERRGPGKR